MCYNIVMDEESVILFRSPISQSSNENYLLACMHLYFTHTIISQKHHTVKKLHTMYLIHIKNFFLLLFQLNNIRVYNHIKIVQIIINNTFINKQYLKKTIHKLTIDNFIKKIKIHNITTYAIANTNKMIEKINEIKNHDVIYKIMNITKEIYISTALYYQVSD